MTWNQLRTADEILNAYVFRLFTYLRVQCLFVVSQWRKDHLEATEDWSKSRHQKSRSSSLVGGTKGEAGCPKELVVTRRSCPTFGLNNRFWSF